MYEIKATANGIKELNAFLDDDRRRQTPVLNPNGEQDFRNVIQQCDAIFRKVTSLIAKAGRSALDTIAEFQREIERSASDQTQVSEPHVLRIELTSIEYLVWPRKRSKLEQCILDLCRLQQSLQFRLTVAILGEVSKRPRKGLFPRAYIYEQVD